MEAIKNQNQMKTALSKQIDPRIDSPQIKVVYPAAPMTLKDLPAEETAVQPSPPTQPTTTVQQGTTEQTATTAPANATSPAPATGWQEVIKQNSMLFIIVGLLSLGIGFMIGKNKG